MPNLELIPQRARPELLELVDRAVAVVNTSDFEGMSNLFLEGWARGVPTLALNHDPDGVIGANGLGGFAAGDPARLVELARKLWDERADQASLAARCRRYATEHHSPGNRRSAVARGRRPDTGDSCRRGGGALAHVRHRGQDRLRGARRQRPGRTPCAR